MRSSRSTGRSPSTSGWRIPRPRPALAAGVGEDRRGQLLAAGVAVREEGQELGLAEAVVAQGAVVGLGGRAGRSRRPSTSGGRARRDRPREGCGRSSRARRERIATTATSARPAATSARAHQLLLLGSGGFGRGLGGQHGGPAGRARRNWNDVRGAIHVRPSPRENADFGPGIRGRDAVHRGALAGRAPANCRVAPGSDRASCTRPTRHRPETKPALPREQGEGREGQLRSWSAAYQLRT